MNKKIQKAHPLDHPGSRQSDRIDQALNPDNIEIDGRNSDQLIEFSRQFSTLLRFPTIDGRELNWSAFFTALGDGGIDEIESNEELSPHAALFLTFLRLYDISRQHLNKISRKHLNFYYRQVLGLNPRAPESDCVHLLFEVAKNRDSAELPKETELKAVDLRYATTREVFPNHATITRLHTVYRDVVDHGRLRYALAANSADGLGAEIEAEPSSWKAFGHSNLPAMKVGFAVSGPILMLAEGTRVVDLTLSLDMDSDALANLPSNDILLAGLEVELSGNDSWLGPLRPVAATLTSNSDGCTLKVSISLGAEMESVSIYDPTKLPGGFSTTAPIIKVSLCTDADPMLYNSLANAFVSAVSVNVSVSGVSDLHLENDLGRLNPEKPFMPFGPQPTKGSRFYIGSPETFVKNLSSFKLRIKWQDVPGDLSDYYKSYLKDIVKGTKAGLKVIGIKISSTDIHTNREVQNNDYFKSRMRLIRQGSSDDGVDLELFHPTDATQPWELDSDTNTPLAGNIRHKIFQGLFTVSVNKAKVQFALVKTPLIAPLIGGFHSPKIKFLPKAQFFPLPKKVKTIELKKQRRLGYIELELLNDFLHKKFPYLYAAAAIDKSSEITPNPPYTPVLESIALDYVANSGPVDPSSNEQIKHSEKILQFFHTTPFGYAEEHGWLKQNLDHVADSRASLFPKFINEGSIFIGIEKAGSGSDIDLLFQVSEGSANPQKLRRTIKWSLLSGNHWQPFGEDEVLRDETNQFLRSGIVTLRLPSKSIPTNTAFDPTLTWINATIDQDADAVCDFIGVHTQVVSAKMTDHGLAQNLSHLGESLPAESIGKLVSQQAGIKSVSQPYASFSGRAAEEDTAFNTRVAERLRHKQRAVTLWDYERLVLEEFPQLYSVKVLNHTQPGSIESPGHVTVVVIPDIKNKNSFDPLQPRTDLDTLSRIQDFISNLAPKGIHVHASNPSFETVQIELNVRFKTQFPFGPYRKQLNQDLRALLSPWLYSDSVKLQFGGVLYKSEVLKFLDDLNYVDRIEGLKIFHENGITGISKDINEVHAVGPDSILVTHKMHIVHDAREELA